MTTLADLDQEIAHNMHDANKVASLVEDYHGAILFHSDTESRQITYTLTFPNVFQATAFAHTARRWFGSVDLQLGSEVMSLDARVTLTATTK